MTSVGQLQELWKLATVIGPNQFLYSLCWNWHQRPLQLLFGYGCFWHLVTCDIFTWPWTVENCGRGEILFRNKLSVSQLSVREFAKWVHATSTQVKHALDGVSSPACFREHRDVSSPALLKSDGVHLNECGQSVYWRSVRAAFVVYTRHWTAERHMHSNSPFLGPLNL